MSKEIIVLSIVSLFWLYYLLFLLRIRIGLSRLSVPHETVTQPSVSVIVAAHNEEMTIRICLLSLLAQSYPKEKIDIIVVDDESSDHTAERVRTLAASHSTVRLVSMVSKGTRLTSRKSEAIAEGIKSSKADLIFTTDADCVTPEGWIESMLSYFDDKTVLVAGPVGESTGINLSARLGNIEFLGLIASAAGLIGIDSPIFCNGANLAYRRSAFLSAGGFGSSPSPCDDELLLQRIHTRRLGSIKYSVDSRSIVWTEPKQSLSSLLSQRVRWASKRGHYEQKRILLTLITLYFSFLGLLVLTIGAFFESSFRLPAIMLLAGKATADYFVLRKSASLFHQRFSFTEFIVAEIFHVPYIVVAALLGQVITPRWKGTRSVS